jgi:hypothetical protein
MLPGTYLEKRRLMAGYSLTGLARELLMLTGFGHSRAESDFLRLRLTLISAEQGALHHSADRIDLIRNFVPLDKHVYFELVALADQGIARRIPGLCQICACSFWDRCELAVDPAAPLGASTCSFERPTVCSACADAHARVPASGSAAAGHQGHHGATIAQQLRDIGERMARMADTANDPCQPMIRLVPKEGEQP